jgi:hypothetical protein
MLLKGFKRIETKFGLPTYQELRNELVRDKSEYYSYRAFKTQDNHPYHAFKWPIFSRYCQAKCHFRHLA